MDRRLTIRTAPSGARWIPVEDLDPVLDVSPDRFEAVARDGIREMEDNDVAVVHSPLSPGAPSLDPEVEGRLARRIEFLRRRRDVSLPGDRPSRDDEFCAARNRLVELAHPLIPSIALGFRRFGVPYADLVQESSVGLLRAAERFDWTRGVRFSTYANFWIREACLRLASEAAGPLRLPRPLRRALVAVRSQDRDLHGWPSSDEEISRRTGLPSSRIRTAFAANRRSFSLDASVDPGAGDGGRPFDGLADPRGGIDFDALDEAPIRRRLADALPNLPARERRILELRFGLGGRPRHTLAEVGGRSGLSLERVRQLQAIALRRLRRAFDEARLPAAAA